MAPVLPVILAVYGPGFGTCRIRVVADQGFPILGQIVPSPGHFQKLIALIPLGHLLGKDPAFLGVFSVFGCGFHSRLYGSW